MNSDPSPKNHGARRRLQRRKCNRPDYCSEEGIALRISEGRGQGEGPNYLPWQDARKFPSKGYRTITFSTKFGRPIHLFSILEWRVFVQLEADDRITSLKEQYPLDRELTRYFAALLGIKHTNAWQTDTVMTTDFLVTMRTAQGVRTRGIAVKKIADLGRRRVVEKLEIARACHAHLGHEFSIMTEGDLDLTLVNNLTFFRAMLRPGAISDLPRALIMAADAMMRPKAYRTPWGQMCAEADAALQRRPGTAARIARFLVASRQWPVDLTQPFNVRSPLTQIQ